MQTTGVYRQQESRKENKSTREQRVQWRMWRTGVHREQEYRKKSKEPENGEYSGECGEQEYTESRRIEKNSLPTYSFSNNIIILPH